MNKTKTITVIPDSVHVSGPSPRDNGYMVKFTLGEYQADQAAEILKIPKMTEIKLTIEWDV